MKLYTLENGCIKTTPVTDEISFSYECDILCIGAGTAGVYAADSAAREGCSVILLENSTCIGGMHLRGNVCSYYYGDEGGSYLEDDAKCNRNVFFADKQQPETKQVILYKRLKESGVKLLCRHCPVGVYFDGNRVIGLSVLTECGVISIKAKIVIDSTSDGHVIRMCPVEKTYGRKSDGKTVPFTVRTQYIENNAIYKSMNDDSGSANQYCNADFSKKVILAHSATERFFEHGDFLNIASLTGIREGLSFEGEECLSYKDIIFDKPCQKPLFYAYSDLDKHGLDFAMDEELFQNWFVISNLSTVTSSIAVPMGCVVPKGLKGIVTACRCFCADSYSISAVRMNRDMFRMGECTGIACAMAIKNNCDFLDIDYGKYVEKVKQKGCFKGQKNRKFGFDFPNGKLPYNPVEFDVEKNFSLLDTNCPGVAIWSCFISDNKAQTSKALYQKLNSSQDIAVKYNCAIALGIIEDTGALPILRQIVQNRDDFYFEDNRRSNQLRSSIAICLLGRIGQEQDITLLEEIVFGEKEHERKIYRLPESTSLPYFNHVYFDVFTHACASLVKLYKKHGHDISSLNKRLKTLFKDNNIVKRVTSAPYGAPNYMEIFDFSNYMLKITDCQQNISDK